MGFSTKEILINILKKDMCDLVICGDYYRASLIYYLDDEVKRAIEKEYDKTDEYKDSISQCEYLKIFNDNKKFLEFWQYQGDNQELVFASEDYILERIIEHNHKHDIIKGIYYIPVRINGGMDKIKFNR